MAPPRLRERIIEHFAADAERADIWGGFERFLDTDSFLNLGYSPWYVPHVVGSSQGRLASRIGAVLERDVVETEGARLLDVGCGRGGPALELASTFGFDVTGIDLVPDNVGLARQHARTRGVDANFVVGDATALPIARGSMAASVAIDALVYVPERATAIAELAGVLKAGGTVVISDLLRRRELAGQDREKLRRFETVWDMPALGTVGEYRAMLDGAGVEIRAVEDITANSVGRFRKWSGLFLGLLDSPAEPALGRLLRRDGLDPETIRTQVRAAHGAVPHLQHVIFVGSG